MAYCEACGHLNLDTARFCRACGTPQDMQAELQSEIKTTPKPPFGAPDDRTGSNLNRWFIVGGIALVGVVIYITLAHTSRSKDRAGTSTEQRQRETETYKGKAFNAETIAQIQSLLAQREWWKVRSMPELQLAFRRVFRDDMDKVENVEGGGSGWVSGDTLVIEACRAHMCPEGFIFTVNLVNGRAAGAMFLDQVAAVHLGDYKESTGLPTPIKDWIMDIEGHFSYLP